VEELEVLPVDLQRDGVAAQLLLPLGAEEPLALLQRQVRREQDLVGDGREDVIELGR